ncbi:MAG: hypothetical protein ACRCXD_11260 [Luteolibacter sp.]
MKWFTFAMLASACMTLSSGAAIMLHQVEDFSVAHDWSGGNPNPNPPVVVADSGPLGSGDFSLRVTSNGGSGPGGKLLIFNTASWAGNYTEAGVTGLSLDIRNTGSKSLSFRLAFNGQGGWFVTPAAPVAAFTGWVHLEFDLRPSSLLNVEGSDAASTMATVNEVRILHTTAVNFRGAQVASSFMVDEIEAIPEPSVWVIAAMAGIGTFFRKR